MVKMGCSEEKTLLNCLIFQQNASANVQILFNRMPVQEASKPMHTVYLNIAVAIRTNTGSVLLKNQIIINVLNSDISPKIFVYH